MIARSRLCGPALALGLFAALAASGQPVRDPAAVAGVDAAQAPTDAGWSAIEHDAYDQRGHFERGARRLSATLDDQIRALRERRATMTVDTKDWDFAMKEVNEARVLLSGRISDLAKVTNPEDWASARDRVGEAWRRSQLAVDGMNGTRTS